MNSRYFFDMVCRMRKAQKNYFKTRDRDALNVSKEIEKQIDEEINRVVEFVKRSGTPVYDEKMTNLDKSPQEEQKELESTSKMDEDDPLYNEVVEFAVRTGKISASLIQRKYRLGYNRAARIIDLLEERGIIGPQNGSKPREVLFKMNKEETGSEEE